MPPGRCATLSAAARTIVSALLLVFSAGMPAPGNVHAGTTVRVVETWPPGPNVALGRNQNFYLRLAYDTDAPVGIWVAAYRDGKRVDVGSNPSQRYAGRGETFGWFFFMRPGDAVDEIRISAGDGTTAHTPVVAVWRGNVVGGGEAQDGQDPPAWVGEMSARAKAAREDAYRERMQAPVSASDTALAGGFMLAMLALGVVGLAAPAWGVWRWQGGWRLAAAVPAAGMAFVALRIVFDTQRDPTSHNLWPFEIIMAGAASAAVMGLLHAARRVFRAG